jgi:hypothetical protein
MRHILVQLAVVLAAWTFRDEVRDKLFTTTLTLCKWYAIARSRSISEHKNKEMGELAVLLRQSVRAAVQQAGLEYDTTAVKHHILLHYGDLIRKFGALLYQSCEMWDSAHKYMIKAHLTSHGKGNYLQAIETRVNVIPNYNKQSI